MIFVEETRGEATEHSHDPKLKLRVRVAAAGVECGRFDTVAIIELAFRFVPFPQISVYEDGRNALLASQSPVAQQPRYYHFDQLFK